MTRNKRSARGAVILIAVVAIAIAGIGYFAYAYFQVRHVEVDGNALYTGPYIAALADVPEGLHMLDVNQDSIRYQIENAEPYLQVLYIERDFPDTLVIHVAERRPVALLPYGDQYLLIDANAVALETVMDPSSLGIPIVQGISMGDVEIGSAIRTEDEFKLSVMLEVLQELKARRLFELIKSVDLSNINNIQLTSAAGLPIRFGQAEKVADKVKWIANRLPALERDGQSGGILDVSAGSFASYTIIGETSSE